MDNSYEVNMEKIMARFSNFNTYVSNNSSNDDNDDEEDGKKDDDIAEDTADDKAAILFKDIEMK